MRLQNAGGGIHPQIVHILCDRALLIAYTEDRRKITARTMALAFRDVMLRPALGSLPGLRKGPVVTTVAALAMAGSLAFLVHLAPPRPEKPAAALAVKSAAAPAAKQAAPQAKVSLPPTVKPPPGPAALPAAAPAVKPTAGPAGVAAAAKPAAPEAAKPASLPVKGTVAAAMPKPLPSHVMRPAPLPAGLAKGAELPAIHIEDRKPVADPVEASAGRPAPADFKRALANELSLRSEAKNAVQAFNALAPLWKAAPVSQMNERPPLINQIKGQAEKRNLELAPFKGKLDDLLRLDSPALLAISPKGTKGNYLVALTGVRNGRLHIHPPLLGRNDFSKAEVASLWSGRAYIPWHNGERIPANLAKGAAGPDVIRLQVLLQTAGVRSVQVTGSYDESTVKGVREFQAARRIGASGKINPVTLIQLYKAVNGASTPSLTKPGKGGGI